MLRGVRTPRSSPVCTCSSAGSAPWPPCTRWPTGGWPSGGTRRLERWQEKLPPAWREAQAGAALLRALCAWSRRFWVLARDEFQRSHKTSEHLEQQRDRFIAGDMLGT